MTALHDMRGRLTDRGDDGVGIIAVIFVMALISAMTITAVGLTKNNLDNVRGDRQSLTALAASEAGVAQAISFLRNGNLAALTCTEPAAGSAPGVACQGPGPSWISATNPQEIRIDGGSGGCVSSSDCFRVWIGTVQPFVPDCPARRQTPPGRCFATYRVHSTGVSGNGPGARRVAVDVKVAPYSYPLGVFSETNFSGNGHVGIHAESVFTGGCIINRQNDAANGSGFKFQWDSAYSRPVLDAFYGIPAAAHAAGVGGISTQNNGACGGGPGGGPIHGAGICNSTFKYDQDIQGGPLTAGDGCYHAFVASDGTTYPQSSKFTQQDLLNIGYRPRGLTDAQYDALRTQAQAEGTYNLATSSINTVLTNLLAAGVTSPVLYWDNGPVSLNQSNFPAAFSRAPSDTPGCAQNTVTIVVTGNNNNLSYQGGNTSPFLTAAIFVPDGTLTGQGGRNTIGTVFARSIDLGGNIDFYLDKCYANSPPGGTLDAQVVNFREDDSQDLN